VWPHRRLRYVVLGALLAVGAIAGPGSAAPARILRDVAYRMVHGETLRMDLWYPSGPRVPLPALILLHGGSWRGGSKEIMAPLAQAAARAGMVGVSVDYRLDAPAPAIPAELSDVRAAVVYLRAHARALGVDPARIGVLGISAGANLGALLATTGGGPLDAGSRVRALVSWSGPMDLVALERETAPPPGCVGEPDCGAMQALSQLISTNVMTGPPEAGLREYIAASPLYHASPDDPPTLMVNSVSEWMPMSQSLAMTAALRGAGVDASFAPVPGSSHGGYQDIAWPPTLRFLRRWLSGPGPRLLATSRPHRKKSLGLVDCSGAVCAGPPAGARPPSGPPAATVAPGATTPGSAPAPAPAPVAVAPPSVQAGVVYGTAAGLDGTPTNLVLDAYLPAGGGSGRPAVVLIHGGGWRSGSRAEVNPIASQLAERGFAAFSIDYRLGLPHPFPAELQDVQQALAFVQAQAGRFGVDPARVALFGLSAGGNLAALAGTLAGGPRPRAVGSWSGPMDLTQMATDAAPRPGCTGINCQLPADIVRDFASATIGCPLNPSVLWTGSLPRPAPCPDLYAYGSPLRQVSSDDPPMLLVQAQADPLVPPAGAGEMSRALTAAGVPSELMMLPGEDHAAQLVDEALPGTIDFLTRELGAP
jgi:acetyl esterase/lipase